MMVLVALCMVLLWNVDLHRILHIKSRSTTAGDAAALASGLQRLATDPAARRRIVSGGLARSRRYQWNVVREQWHELYGELLHLHEQATEAPFDAARQGREPS